MPRISTIISLYILITLGLSFEFSLFFLFMLIAPLVLFIIDLIEETTYFKAFLFTIIGRYKRIKTEYGRFYVRYVMNKYGNSEIYLYQDKFWYLKEIGSKYYTDIKDMKNWVKSCYDAIYATKIKEENYNKSLREQYIRENKEIKNWNGYIDIRDERDGKIDSIVS